MDRMISYCGLACNTCPIYLATIERDELRKQQMRESIAKQCAEQYDLKLRIEDITDCDGCRADSGRLFSGCIKCEIRKCATERKIETCAYCSDYACEKLEKHFSLEPESKKRLEELRALHKS